MSQENVETLRDGFEAFARGDVDDVLERLDQGVNWSPAIGPILGVETVRGTEDLRRFLTRDLFDGFDQFGAEPLSIEDLGGEYVLVMVRYTGRGQSTGIEMNMTSASLYRMRDGKVVTMRDYSTRAEALEAAGLSE